MSKLSDHLSRVVDDHPGIHLARAWMWWLLVPVFIALGWHTSVFVIFIWSTYANFASDRGVYEAAKARKENAS